jgi:transcriptional regulator with XRE-family HTH domain
MPTQRRLLSIGQRRGERLVRELADAIREARIGLGLSFTRLSILVGISRSRLWRIESAKARTIDLVELSSICQVLGLDLSIRTFPTGAPVRDVGHIRLIDRLVAATPSVTWHREHPIPISGDLRAWDLFARVDGASVGVTAETRLRDEQALLRREHGKVRDGGVQRLILLIADTRANRSTLKAIRESLRTDFPLDARQVLSALRAGRDPGANGILVL